MAFGDPVDDAPKTDWEKAVSTEMLTHLERWRNMMVRELPMAREATRPELRLHITPEDWRAGWLGVDAHEYDIGGMFHHELGQLAPQALLRDLHRPVTEPSKPRYEQRGQAVDFAGSKGFAEAKAAARFERAQPLPSLLQAVRERQQQRRAWLASVWPAFYRDDETHPPVSVVRWSD